jgi:hypothetical protein
VQEAQHKGTSAMEDHSNSSANGIEQKEFDGVVYRECLPVSLFSRVLEASARPKILVAALGRDRGCHAGSEAVPEEFVLGCNCKLLRIQVPQQPRSLRLNTILASALLLERVVNCLIWNRMADRRHGGCISGLACRENLSWKRSRGCSCGTIQSRSSSPSD